MHDKANKFRDLHLSGNTFIMANAWNPGSAVLLEEAGFSAIGTTSAGIAFSRALPDYVGDISLDTALEETNGGAEYCRRLSEYWLNTRTTSDVLVTPSVGPV